MTEAEWLACAATRKMFEYLEEARPPTQRKLRLFAVASCRRQAYWLPERELVAALDVAERFADGFATEAALIEADRAAVEIEDSLEADEDPETANAADAFYLAAKAVGQATSPDHPECPYRYRMTDVVLHTSRAAAFAAVAAPWWSDEDRVACWKKAMAAEEQSLALLVRDIFGNPFRPVTLDPAWRTSDVLALARGIYEERAFDRMPILADAPQDAGCDNGDILSHCRGPGPHVRGCWVVDLILGKQ